MKLLHLDSSILGANSVSRSLSAAIVARLRGSDPNLTVTYRDLVNEPLSHLSGAYLAAMTGAGAPHSTTLQHDLAVGSDVLEEFLAADLVVIGVAFYNFTIPSQLKTWIDRIMIVGKTFRYTEEGPQGLMGGKRLILAIARGGLYGPGAPAQHAEHAETYLRAAFGFLGIYNPQVVVAEGIAISSGHRKSAIDAAFGQIEGIQIAT